MFVLAAIATFTERMSQIPMEFWLKAGAAVLIVVAVVFALRKLAKMNKVVLGVIVFVGSTIIGFNWIYERNEPDWASPVVSWLAEYFPTKGKAAKK